MNCLTLSESIFEKAASGIENGSDPDFLCPQWTLASALNWTGQSGGGTPLSGLRIGWLPRSLLVMKTLTLPTTTG